jgi:tRNA (guanine-N7-)-methyltransferase
LGRLHPDHTIIGVDRSLARLSKNGVYRQQSSEKGEGGNVFLVRAELADFWRLWLETPLGSLEKHFLLYPNPYPKKRRFQTRWYAHPAFPLIRRLGGAEIVVRSNWKAYLKDFSTAMAIGEELEGNPPIYRSSGPVVLDPKQDAWTAFEQKYFDVGETAYELMLTEL